MDDYYKQIAELYDYDIGLNRGLRDFPFYAKECQESILPILECACGTGRLTIPLAQCEYQIHGLDISSEMLHQLSRKKNGIINEVRNRITLQHGDFRYMDMFFKPGTFSNVLVPYSAIMYILDICELDMFFKAVSTILCPGGSLIFDWFIQDPNLLESLNQYKFDYKRSLSKPTNSVIGQQWNEFSREKRIEQSKDHKINFIYKKYSFFFDSILVGELATEDKLRLYSIDEIVKLSSRYGFENKIIDNYLVGPKNDNDLIAYVGRLQNY